MLNEDVYFGGQAAAKRSNRRDGTARPLTPNWVVSGERSGDQDDLSGGVPATAEFQRLFGLRKWKNRLNERLELAFIDDLPDVRELSSVGLYADHDGAYALFPGEI